MIIVHCVHVDPSTHGRISGFFLVGAIQIKAVMNISVYYFCGHFHLFGIRPRNAVAGLYGN